MNKNNKNFVVVIVVVLVLLVFFSQMGIFSFFSSVLKSIFNPLKEASYNLSLGFKHFKNINQLEDDNKRLLDEVAKLSIDYIKLTDLEAENKYLRQELNFLTKNNYNYELASIIGRAPLNDQILIINKGIESGLKAGQVATVNQGIIVGEIIKVEDQKSYIELLSSTNSQLAGTLSHLTGTNGMVVGKVGSGLVMELIPQDKELAVDDVVITSGLEEQIPRGLYVGRISEIESIVGQIFKQARIEPAVDYNNLQTLTIIK